MGKGPSHSTTNYHTPILGSDNIEENIEKVPQDVMRQLIKEDGNNQKL